MNAKQAEADLIGFPANKGIKVAATESIEERKQRLLKELEDVQNEEILTERQQEEAEKKAKMEKEKDEIYYFFKSHFGGFDGNFGSTYIGEIRAVIQEELNKTVPLDLLVQQHEEPTAVSRVSTPFALKSLGGIIAVCLALFVGLMMTLSNEGDTPTSMQNMFNAFPMRFLLNVLLIATALGIAFCYCFFFHPEVWGYFHSKIKSRCSPQSDWNAASPQFRLQFLSDLLWKWALSFIIAFLVIFV